jgi:hypothetical protein
MSAILEGNRNIENKFMTHYIPENYICRIKRTAQTVRV